MNLFETNDFRHMGKRFIKTKQESFLTRYLPDHSKGILIFAQLQPLDFEISRTQTFFQLLDAFEVSIPKGYTDHF